MKTPPPKSLENYKARKGGGRGSQTIPRFRKNNETNQKVDGDH